MKPNPGLDSPMDVLKRPSDSQQHPYAPRKYERRGTLLRMPRLSPPARGNVSRAAVCELDPPSPSVPTLGPAAMEVWHLVHWVPPGKNSRVPKFCLLNLSALQRFSNRTDYLHKSNACNICRAKRFSRGLASCVEGSAPHRGQLHR